MKKLTDLRQTEEYSEYIKKIGWKVDKFQDTYIFLKKFLFWNFVKVQRPDKLVGSELLSYLVKEFEYSTIYVEPSNNDQYEDLLRSGFRKYNSPFLPSKTVQIDLTKSEAELLMEMHYKTRYNITHNSKLKNQNSKVKIFISNDIDNFSDFWQRCARKRGMILSQKEEIRAIYDSFRKDACIHVAIDGEGDWLAAILRISTSKISYYMYAAATSMGKKLFAPTVLTWEAVRLAKKERKKIFDFEGVYDERFPLKSWKGFSRFKKGFGGREIEYPGCVSKIII